MKNKIIMAASLLAFGTAAHAEILAGGPINGGQSQTTATCYLFNAGSASVSITGKGIRKVGSATPLTLTHDFCGASLAAGNGCVIQTNVFSGDAHSCRFVVSPSGADVRGSLEVRDSVGNILNQADLR